jgi:hypothetical protein
MKQNILFLILIVAFVTLDAVEPDSLYKEKNFRMLFRANGQVTLGGYIYGHNKYSTLTPAYRSDILVYSDLLAYKNLTFDFLTGATTDIARLPESPIKMNKIRYTLSPGLRYTFRQHMVTGLFFHECFHTLSRAEDSGSTWWNAVQLGGGTKGAYHFYLIEKYRNRDFSLRNSFDLQCNMSAYVQGRSLWTGQNHHYKYDMFGLARYHAGLFHNQTFYFDLKPHFWYDTYGKVTMKIVGEVNWVILAFDNIGTIYFSHCFRDDNPYDNEATLGAVGVKVIF